MYKISCDDCDASYVGKTKRKLSTRLLEHISDMNKKVSHLLHLIITSILIKFRWNDVKILDNESFYNKRLISEMINIKRQGLNKQNNTESLPESYSQIIQSFSLS